MNDIVILDASTLGPPSILDKLKSLGNLKIYETTAPDQTISHIGDSEIIITNKVVINRSTMEACPQMKLICISATGMNNVDLEAARQRGIEVKNAVGYSTQSVAQHTFSVLFQLYQQINYYDKYVKSGNYSKSPIFTHYGPVITELYQKQFGIIGLGNIGKAVAGIAEAFGAQVSYYSTSGSNHNDRYPSKTLSALLTESDIISIHAPLNKNTEKLIGTHEFSLMKAKAILINAGRGGIVDEAALAKAIDEANLYGACIDVYEKEPLPADNPLLQVAHQERLVLTPHTAWASLEARHRLIDIIYNHVALSRNRH